MWRRRYLSSDYPVANFCFPVYRSDKATDEQFGEKFKSDDSIDSHKENTLTTILPICQQIDDLPDSSNQRYPYTFVLHDITLLGESRIILSIIDDKKIITTTWMGKLFNQFQVSDSLITQMGNEKSLTHAQWRVEYCPTCLETKQASLWKPNQSASPSLQLRLSGSGLFR